VATVLWDRQYKSWLVGKAGAVVTPGEYERRGVVEAPDGLVFAVR
jgi:hypothetical protein